MISDLSRPTQTYSLPNTVSLNQKLPHDSSRVLPFLVVVVLRSPIHANEPSEYNGMLYRSSNRVLNNGIKVIILICMDGTSQYHHYQLFVPTNLPC